MNNGKVLFGCWGALLVWLGLLGLWLGFGREAHAMPVNPKKAAKAVESIIDSIPKNLKDKGYSISIDEVKDADGILHRVLATDKNGKKVGEATFIPRQSKDLSQDILTPNQVEVNKDHRRQGIASSMYEAVEKHLKKPIEVSNIQDADGKALWSNPKRNFGLDKWKNTDAASILERINTPEKAVALKGAERAEYLAALDAVHGPRDARAKAMGIDYNSLVDAHKKADLKAKKNKVKTLEGNDVDYTDADDGEAEQFLADNPHLRPVDFGASVGKNHGAGELRAQKHESGEKIFVNDVNVEDAFKRMGVGTELYRAAEKHFGLPLEAGVTGLSNESRALWAQENKAFGNRRLPEAAFDPRFKRSPLLLSVKGRQAAPGISSIANPATLAQKAYEAYSGKLSDAASSISDRILDATTPQGLPGRQKFIDANKPAVALGTELVVDPLNFVGAPIATASKIAKGMKAAKAINAVPEAAKAVEFAREGSRVINSGQPAIETAMSKVTRIPDQVVADIASRPSLSAEQKKKIIERIRAEQPPPQASAKAQETVAKIVQGRMPLPSPQKLKDEAGALYDALKASND